MSPLEVAQRHLAATPYRLDRELGRGGMGAVFLARHEGLGRYVVVKLMHTPMGDSAVADRMRLEAQALARLHHPNIVEVLDFGRAGRGRAFVAMEYLQGRPLDRVLAERGALPVDEALHYAVQALDGLEHVHRSGVIHRDVKPANLFVLEDGRLKLLDFGVVKLMETAGSLVPIAIPTAEGAAVGTPKYMAPEQAAATTVDARVDVYAVGTVLYEMVAGRSPFEHHTNMAEMMIAQAKEQPLPPSRYAPRSLPAGFDELVLKAIDKSRRRRYPTAADFAAAIRSFQLDLSDPGGRALRRQARTVPLRQAPMPLTTEPLGPLVAAAPASTGGPASHDGYGPTGTVVEGVAALAIEDEAGVERPARGAPAGEWSPPPGPTPPPAPVEPDTAPLSARARAAIEAEIRAVGPPSAARRPPASRSPSTDRRSLAIAAALLVFLSIAFGWLLRDLLQR